MAISVTHVVGFDNTFNGEYETLCYQFYSLKQNRYRIYVTEEVSQEKLKDLEIDGNRIEVKIYKSLKDRETKKIIIKDVKDAFDIRAIDKVILFVRWYSPDLYEFFDTPVKQLTTKSGYTVFHIFSGDTDYHIMYPKDHFLENADSVCIYAAQDAAEYPLKAFARFKRTESGKKLLAMRPSKSAERMAAREYMITYMVTKATLCRYLHYYKKLPRQEIIGYFQLRTPSVFRSKRIDPIEVADPVVLFKHLFFVLDCYIPANVRFNTLDYRYWYKMFKNWLGFPYKPISKKIELGYKRALFCIIMEVGVQKSALLIIRNELFF
jgi:hypothetical protein